MAETDYVLRIVSKVDAETRTKWSFDDPFVAGTGPYALKEWKQGQYVRYERAPGKHYRKTPDFAEFEYRFYPEPSTRLAAPARSCSLAGKRRRAEAAADLKMDRSSLTESRRGEVRWAIPA